MVYWNPSKILRSHLLWAAGGLSPWPWHWSSWCSCCQESGSRLGPCEQVLTLRLGRCQESAYWDQVGPPVFTAVNLGLECGLEWPHVMGSEYTPSPWSLVLLVVGWVWTKDKLFLRDQPFKIHCTLSMQIFLSLRWILDALKSCFFPLSF